MNSYLSPDSIVGQDILSNVNDEILVTEARSGEDLAFSELWNRHSKRKYSRQYICLREIVRMAEDVLQDAFLKAFVHLKSFHGRSTFSTWLTRIAINSALMMLRKKRAHPETSIHWSANRGTWPHSEIADQNANTEGHYARREAERQLKRAIHNLRPTPRKIIQVQQLHDSSVKEMAEIAGISVAATKSRLLRARAELRRSLG